MRRLAPLVLVLAGAGLGLWIRQERGATAPSSQGVPAVVQESSPSVRARRVLEAPSRSPTTRARLHVCPGEVYPQVLDPSEPVNAIVAELWDRARWLFASADRGSASLRNGLWELYAEHGDRTEALRLIGSAPDRLAQGFDVLRAARVTLAVRQLRENPASVPEAALALGEAEPLGAVLAALAADRRGDARERARWLEEAHRRDPQEPSLAARAALARAARGDAVLAMRALDAYAELVPDDPWPQAVRGRWRNRAQHERALETDERGGVRLRFPRGLDPSRSESMHHAAIQALDDAAAMLGTERRPELTVIIYPDRATFAEATCGPSWSGGLYDGVLHIPLVGDSATLVRRLRHESVHAQLHYSAPGAPVWLHEGLAQRLEGRPTSGLSRSLARIRRDRAYVPFPSIEGSFVVIDDSADARFVYHQSYAMVQALIDLHGPAVITRAVSYLDGGNNPDSLLEGLSDPPFSGDQLLAWIDQQPN